MRDALYVCSQNFSRRMFAAHITACKFEIEDNEVYSSSTHNTKISDDSCCMKLLLTHAVLNSTIHSTHFHGTFFPRTLKQGSIYMSNKNHRPQKCYKFFFFFFGAYIYTVTGWGCDLSSDTEDNWSCTGLVRCVH